MATVPRITGTPGPAGPWQREPLSSKPTTQTLAAFAYTVEPHRPYFPDLAPTDYALFNEMKEPLGGRKIQTADYVKRVVRDSMRSISKEW